MEEQILYPEIAHELDTMCEADQAMRRRYSETKNKSDWDNTVDHRNTARLQAIVKEVGWPSIAKVGKEASFHAWLLIQHADHNIEFQKKCLWLMKELPAEEINKANIAYLEDRIAVGEGRPQLYGTQFYESDGQLLPRPTEDMDNLERRRKDMGLEPFEEYSRLMNKDRNSA